MDVFKCLKQMILHVVLFTRADRVLSYHLMLVLCQKYFFSLITLLFVFWDTILYNLHAFLVRFTSAVYNWQCNKNIPRNLRINKKMKIKLKRRELVNKEHVMSIWPLLVRKLKCLLCSQTPYRSRIKWVRARNWGTFFLSIVLRWRD